jgi:hypothetical protein
MASRWQHLEEIEDAFELVPELAGLSALDKTTYSAYEIPAVREAER